jgi:hypothetical protein
MTTATHNMYLETDLSKIKQLAAKREDENFRFRAFLKVKDSNEVDSIVHRLHEKYVSLRSLSDCLQSDGGVEG